ncbi:hypothetical protein PBY51_024708 [Eleginops maclovinus]|uniref:Uncharacterized protein n=1 Tax=Eleginops maclovinus TaxID=56733 RepID=A0AAN8AV68_ELEMC|nr:hypothetical protein PBY51_024708 [Eleginops maclovinus]
MPERMDGCSLQGLRGVHTEVQSHRNIHSPSEGLLLDLRVRGDTTTSCSEVRGHNKTSSLSYRRKKRRRSRQWRRNREAEWVEGWKERRIEAVGGGGSKRVNPEQVNTAVDRHGLSGCPLPVAPALHRGVPWSRQGPAKAAAEWAG